MGRTGLVQRIQHLSSGEAERRVVGGDDQQRRQDREHSAKVAGGEGDLLGAIGRYPHHHSDEPCERTEDTAPRGDIAEDHKPER